MTLSTSPLAYFYTTSGNYKVKFSTDVEENAKRLHF